MEESLKQSLAGDDTRKESVLTEAMDTKHFPHFEEVRKGDAQGEAVLKERERDYLMSAFGLKEQAWDQYSPLTLAYLGDAVYDLVIRTIFVKQANTQAVKLHQKTSSLVKAAAQAQMITVLLPHLTEVEQRIYRRGRNAKPYNTAKNATRKEYLEATGFEAVIGYLYLEKEYRRIIDLVKLGLEESGHAI